MRTADDIQDDLERIDHGDKEIAGGLERLRRMFKDKGIPYHELLRSKFFGTIKYLLVELQDEHGTVLITDLDTNQTYRFTDEFSKVQEVKTKKQVREWIGRH